MCCVVSGEYSTNRDKFTRVLEMLLILTILEYDPTYVVQTSMLIV